MNYNTVQEALERVELPLSIEALSVYRAFEQVQDGRHKRGVRYSMALILTLIVLGKLAGMTTLAAIADWVRLRADWLNQVLPNPRKSFPCAATVSQCAAGRRPRADEPGADPVSDPRGGDRALWRGA